MLSWEFKMLKIKLKLEERCTFIFGLYLLKYFDYCDSITFNPPPPPLSMI